MKEIELTPNALKYFDRLKLPTDAKYHCNKELLNLLQYAHVTTIPYENLDILNGIPLPLEYEGLFDKIVMHRRGGYCFELNGLFAALLRELGYTVTTYMARYLRGESVIPMRRHRVIKAECADGSFICDVGVGQQAPRQPLAFIPGLVQEQFGETYKILKEDFLGFVIYDLHKGEWRKFYSFTEEEQLDIDFVMPSFYCENAPDSIFKASEMISIKTIDGRKTIDDDIFRIFSHEGVFQETISSAEQMKEILDQHFGINLSTNK